MSPLKVEVRVQSNDFDIEMEIENLRLDLVNIGAIVTFCGLVREFEGNEAGRNLDVLSKLILEHYPEMSRKVLGDLCKNAAARWDLKGLTLIHRVGKLYPGENIVLLIISASHRTEAYKASEFLMDFLKSRAPFWKKETTANGATWIEENERDNQKLLKWK